jgi:excisionase family DNA binding protein
MSTYFDNGISRRVEASQTEGLQGASRAALMDAEQASKLLGVPKSWLLAQARAGKAPHVRLGRYVRFQQSDIEALIASGAAGKLRSYTNKKWDRAGATAGPVTPGGKS